MLRFLFFFACLSCYSKLFFKSVRFSNCKEFDFILSNSFPKIVCSRNEDICLIDCNKEELKVIFKFEKKQVIAPKLGIFENIIFFNTPDGDFNGLNFNGDIIFSKNLISVSRSNVFAFEDTIIFNLVNQYVVCYSKDGELLWVNEDFYTTDHILNSKLLVSDYIYFMHKFGFAVLDKRTGKTLFNNSDFLKVEDFYLTKDVQNGKNIIVSYDNNIFMKIDLKNKEVEKTSECRDNFISNGVVYSYSDGVLKNKTDGKNYNIKIERFKFFEDRIFGICGSKIVIINGNNVIVDDMGFSPDKILYKDGFLIAADNNMVKWVKI